MPGSRKQLPMRKSASCQVYTIVSHINSCSSETSTSTSSSSENYDTPLRRFNRILRASVARHWPYFKRNSGSALGRSRGRSVSDTGLSEIVEKGPDLAYLDIQAMSPRRSLQTIGKESNDVPTLFITSAGGSSSVGAEEASDGSDAERPRRGHHLRVPTPAPPQTQDNFNGEFELRRRVRVRGGSSAALAAALPLTDLQVAEAVPRGGSNTRQGRVRVRGGCSTRRGRVRVRGGASIALGQGDGVVEAVVAVVVPRDGTGRGRGGRGRGGRRGRGRAVAGSDRPGPSTIEELNMYDISELPVGQPLEVALHPNRKRRWPPSTGNFAAGAAGGGCGAPRSAPATPLQLEPHPPRSTKHEKQAIKPLSGSAPSVRAPQSAAGTGDTTDGKQPSKSRQKKFQRHFPQVGPEERVLNYYSCALVGDLLLQGHLYITKNYFAFYSNVFGYVTKLLIPTISVLRITKEKVARIIPNAVGVCTRDERHVFGSLLSRDSTYKLMMHVWKAARAPEQAVPKPQDLRASEVDLEVSEYSPEDDSSSAGGDQPDAPSPPVRRESEAIIAAAGGAAVIQPALIIGSGAATRAATRWWRPLLALVAALLTFSAVLLAYKLYVATYHVQEDLVKLSGEELYSELVRWRARLHGRAANELHAFLTTNLLLLTKVRQSLEALSGVILTDMAQTGTVHLQVDVPNDTVFS